MVSGPDTSMLPSRRIAGLNLGIQFSFLLERDNGNDNRAGTEIMQAERIARKTRLRVHRIVIPRLSP